MASGAEAASVTSPQAAAEAAGAFRTLDDLGDRARQARCCVRVDLNVPIENGKVSDATRIERIVPTLRELSDAGGKVILLSHFGRPKGAPDPKYSLEIVVPALRARSGAM